MHIITLTTDFGTKDYSVGLLKGAIYKLIPQATIVDLSHHIEPFDMMQTSFVLRNSFPFFPEHTIHIIGVDNELSIKKKLMVMKFKNQFFISADNGFFSIFNKNFIYEKIYFIDIDRPSTFPTLDYSISLAKLIIDNHFNLDGILPEVENKNQLKILSFSTPIEIENTLQGKVIYIDAYGNIISNISKDLIKKDLKFNVYLGNYHFEDFSYTKILTQYNQIEITDTLSDKNTINTSVDDYSLYKKPFLLFNQSNLLELAMYKSNLKTWGGASSLLGIKVNDAITIKYLH